MYQFRKTVGGLALSLLLCGILAGPAILEAQVAVPDASVRGDRLPPGFVGRDCWPRCAARLCRVLERVDPG